MKNKPLIIEIWDFLRIRKKYWLLPAIVMLILLSILIFLTESTAISPFIYALS